MNIELFCIRGFTGNALKRRLEQALADRHMPYTIIEINHVDQFIKAGLASIPAFRIGDKVIQYPQDGDIDETITRVMDYILGEQVKAILVPIDFSKESELAVTYASMMAQQLGYNMTLAHIHQTLYDPVSAGALDVQFLHDTNKRLIEMVDVLNAKHAATGINVDVKVHLEVGEPMTSLIELLNHGHFELMVMATRATDNAVRRLFGTVSSNVSRHSNKPVIVIPPQSEIRFPQKVVIGFTEELLADGALEYILTFGNKNHTFFEFVHVTDDQVAFNSLRSRLYEKLDVYRSDLNGFEIRSFQPGDLKIHEALFMQASEAHAEMVILLSHHRSFVENITHSSVTKKALQNPPVPLMIIHTPVSQVKH